MGFFSDIADTVKGEIGGVFGGGGGGGGNNSEGGNADATGGGGGQGGNATQDQSQTLEVSNDIYFDMDKLAEATLGSGRLLSASEVRAAEIRAESERVKASAGFSGAVEAASVSSYAELAKADAQVKSASIAAQADGQTVSIIADLAGKAGKGAAVLIITAFALYLYTHKKGKR